MDTLINEQRMTGEYIARAVINLRKKGEVTPQMVNARIKLVENYWSQCLERNWKIMKQEGIHETAYCTDKVFELIEDVYLEIKSELEEMLGENVAVTSATRSIDTTMVSPTTNNPSGIKVNLPKLDLPKFDGNKMEWESFRDMFSSLVISNESVPNVNKLQYLKLSVTGEPASLLRNIAITDKNWNGAWQALIDRYDDKKALLTTHLDSLLNIPAAQFESSTELKRILDAVQDGRRGLTNLDRPVEHWDDWFVHIAVSRLDPTTRKAWEVDQVTPGFSTLNDVVKFFEKMIRALESVPTITTNDINKKQPRAKSGVMAIPAEISLPSVQVTSKKENYARERYSMQRTCYKCKEDHLLFMCTSFQESSPEERYELVKNNNLCFNCFGRHPASECTNIYRCRICKRKHHSILHEHFENLDKTAVVTATPSVLSSIPQVLLATVKVRIVSSGRSIVVRALLDPAAEANFVSEYIVQELGLKRQPTTVRVDGIGGSQPAQPKYSTFMELQPTETETASFKIRALVLKNVLSTREPLRVKMSNFPHLQQLCLADPDFATGCRPEMILGCAVYSEVIRSGIVRGPAGTPIAQETSLGWVIMGQVAETRSDRVLSLPCLVNENISDRLRAFWELEEMSMPSPLTEEEEKCEAFFERTFTRDPICGNYTVRLPLREGVPLGESRTRALHCLLQGERRRARDDDLNKEYVNFMKEYENLNHMIESTPKPDANFLPHHAIFKDKKIRVVFNAAAETSSSKSLNDALMTGPRLQRDVDEVLLNWRRYQVVFTCDIVKMFRAILVHEEDQDLQRILWRSESDCIKEFKLRTVTYGTSCAPYLACRTLKQLAMDEKSNHPLGAEVLLKETYVDDCFSGGDDLIEASIRKTELATTLTAGGFALSKWSANVTELLPKELNMKSGVLELLDKDVVKTLGVSWSSSSDTFQYSVSLDHSQQCTRRSVLSQIARLYDPLGFLTPVTVMAKIFMQRLWILHCEWDSELPVELANEWSTYYEDLLKLDCIAVPRWIDLLKGSVYQIHGFCDSSELAYAACVYIRVLNGTDVTVHLLSSKTKVAPIKTQSIPRLELCGAVLLSQLVAKIMKIYPAGSEPYLWTGSSVTLSWLRGHPSRWRPFVANRVSNVHETLPRAIWRHVRTEDNPADIPTRGLSAANIQKCERWWHGPSWLSLHQNQWPEQPEFVQTDSELRSVKAVPVTVTQDWELIRKFSSFNKLLGVTAAIIRFVKNCRRAKVDRIVGHISADELRQAQVLIIKKTQDEYFTSELKVLQARNTPKSGRLRGSNPFLDEHEIIRLGGRLENSALSYDERHPIVLPGESPLAKLLIENAHLKTLHGGAQLTLSHLHRTFWLLNGKRYVKRVVRNCGRCFRFRPKPEMQVMGQLPAVRCTGSRPFLHTGVDYAGPIDLRTSKGRGNKSYKGYIALFVCMATKAVHIEAVSDLTTAGFLAALQRFVARRGLVQAIYSDNGTNFTGASKELRKMFNEAQTAELKGLLAKDRIDWIFIPPRAPHWGGLWEAAVKSCKHHLRRVIGQATLTFEELSTVLTQVEACLNSRPISVMSTEPNDFNALTPGHFLVGHALTTIPEASVLDTNINRLTRWKLLRQMYESFWKRWKSDYLHHLQQRTKWTKEEKNIEVDDLVLIIEDGMAPSKWRMGRIEEVHPGKDGRVRVVNIRTETGTLTRPIVKIAKIPISSS